MNEEVKHRLENGMDLYFEMKENESRLNEPNRMLIAQTESVMASLNNDEMKSFIDGKLEKYDQAHDIGYNNTADLPIVTVIHPLVRKRSNPEATKVSRAGFINTAILLYGIINIGIILAIALMK